MTRTRITVLMAVALALMAGAIGYAVYRQGTGDLLQALRTARWGYAPLAALAALAVYPIKAWRWRLILGNPRGVRYRTLLSAIMIGFMCNCIFSRIGEIVRAVVMSLKKEMRTSAALASIALERIFDTAVVVLFLVIGLLWLNPATTSDVIKYRVSGLIAAAGLGVACGFLILLRFRPKPTSRLILRCLGWLPERFRRRAEEFVQTFLEGLLTIRSFKQLAGIIALSLLHWVFPVMFFLFSGLCLPDAHVTIPVALLVFGVTAFGVAGLPLPGYVGVFQFAIWVAGAIAGAYADPWAPTAPWLSYSWLTWALNIPIVILAGFVFMWMEGLSLSKLRGEAASGRSD